MINYVELLRVRNSLLLYSAILLALVLIVAAIGESALHGGAHVRVSSRSLGVQNIPFSAIVGICGYCMAVFATVVGTSVCSERRAVLAWTRPQSRERIFASYALVDIASIVVAFAIAIVFGALLPLAIFGQLGGVHPDALWLPLAGLFFGISLMWYGVLQAVAAWTHLPGGAIAGVSWGVFITLVALGTSGDLPPAAHAFLTAVNLVNPLAYITSVTGTTGDHGIETVASSSLFTLAMGPRTLLVCAIALAAGAVAIAGWKRAEI